MSDTNIDQLLGTAAPVVGNSRLRTERSNAGEPFGELLRDAGATSGQRDAPDEAADTSRNRERGRGPSSPTDRREDAAPGSSSGAAEPPAAPDTERDDEPVADKEPVDGDTPGVAHVDAELAAEPGASGFQLVVDGHSVVEGEATGLTTAEAELSAAALDSAGTATGSGVSSESLEVRQVLTGELATTQQGDETSTVLASAHGASDPDHADRARDGDASGPLAAESAELVDGAELVAQTGPSVEAGVATETVKSAAATSGSRRTGSRARSDSDQREPGEGGVAEHARAGRAELEQVAQNAIASVDEIVDAGLDADIEPDSDPLSASPVGEGNRADHSLSALERLQRSQFSASRSQASAAGSDGPQIDAGRFVSRVTRAFHAASDRGGQIQLRLSPPDLGSLRLEISVKEGAITATIETQTSTARNLLLDNLPLLRERLSEQGMRIDKFDVDVGREGEGQPRESNTGERSESQERRFERGAMRPAAAPVESTPDAAPKSIPVTGDATINLVI